MHMVFGLECERNGYASACQLQIGQNTSSTNRNDKVRIFARPHSAMHAQLHTIIQQTQNRMQTENRLAQDRMYLCVARLTRDRVAGFVALPEAANQLFRAAA